MWKKSEEARRGEWKREQEQRHEILMAVSWNGYQWWNEGKHFMHKDLLTSLSIIRIIFFFFFSIEHNSHAINSSFFHLSVCFRMIFFFSFHNVFFFFFSLSFSGIRCLSMLFSLSKNLLQTSHRWSSQTTSIELLSEKQMSESVKTI